MLPHLLELNDNDDDEDDDYNNNNNKEVGSKAECI
jgi:hypothetical protein